MVILRLGLCGMQSGFAMVLRPETREWDHTQAAGSLDLFGRLLESGRNSRTSLTFLHLLHTMATNIQAIAGQLQASLDPSQRHQGESGHCK